MVGVPEHTVLPPADPAQVEELAALAALVERSLSAEVVAPDGTHAPLPAPLLRALVEMIQALRSGCAVTVAALQLRLTTREASELLGVSRPTLVKLLEEGRIPFEQPGLHRRVRLQDVLDYRDRRRRERRLALDEMVRETEALGLYDE